MCVTPSLPVVFVLYGSRYIGTMGAKGVPVMFVHGCWAVVESD